MKLFHLTGYRMTTRRIYLPSFLTLYLQLPFQRAALICNEWACPFPARYQHLHSNAHPHLQLSPISFLSPLLIKKFVVTWSVRLSAGNLSCTGLLKTLIWSYMMSKTSPDIFAIQSQPGKAVRVGSEDLLVSAQHLCLNLSLQRLPAGCPTSR